MARSRSSRPAPSRAPARAPSRSVPAAPQRSAPPAPQQSQQSGGMMSGFASTIAQGFAFGTGSAVAHRAVGAAAGAFSGDSEAPQHHETHPQQVMQQQQHAYGAPAGQQACSLDGQNFQACLQANPGNVDACTFLYEALQQCQRNSQFQKARFYKPGKFLQDQQFPKPGEARGSLDELGGNGSQPGGLCHRRHRLYVRSSPWRVPRENGPAAANAAPNTSAFTENSFRKHTKGIIPADSIPSTLPATSSVKAAAVMGGRASPGRKSSPSSDLTSTSSISSISAHGPSSIWSATAAAAIAAASFKGKTSSTNRSVHSPRPPKPLRPHTPTSNTTDGSLPTANSRLDPRFHSFRRADPLATSSFTDNGGDDDILPFNVESGQAGGEDAFGLGGHPGFFSKDSYKILPHRREPPKGWMDNLPPFLNPRKLTRRQQALCLMLTVAVLLFLIGIVISAARRTGIEALGPGGDDGAAGTGIYRNLFTEVMDKSIVETDTKLEGVWDNYFKGDIEKTGLYVEVEPNMAQIINTESNVVTSEGISYGMITCVHLQKQEAFNRLWNWARFHMQHTAGTYETFFAWRVTRGGLLIDAKDVVPAPDAEAYIATALIAAHRKWGSSIGYPYKAEAMRLIHAMGNSKKGFFTKDGKATFNPTDWGLRHSNPSYHLPHFYEAFARFLKNEGDPRAAKFWSKSAMQSRKFFHVAADPKTGLIPDYTTLEGKGASDPNLEGHSNFQWDAWRAPANVAVDWAWWNMDGWQQKYADRFLGFFASQGPKYGSQFTMDGKLADNNSGHDAGLVSMNAVVALATKDEKLMSSFVKELWEQDMPEGKGRYYPAMLYMMSLLHCSGRFQAYF